MIKFLFRTYVVFAGIFYLWVFWLLVYFAMTCPTQRQFSLFDQWYVDIYKEYVRVSDGGKENGGHENSVKCVWYKNSDGEYYVYNPMSLCWYPMDFVPGNRPGIIGKYLKPFSKQGAQR